MRNLKQSPSVSNALKNCFMRQSFMCKNGNVIFFMSTTGSRRILGSSGLRSDLWSQFRSTQCFSRTLLLQGHRKQKYVVWHGMLPREGKRISIPPPFCVRTNRPQRLTVKREIWTKVYYSHSMVCSLLNKVTNPGQNEATRTPWPIIGWTKKGMQVSRLL